MRRSVLYMPADSLRKITKATTLAVDSIVMDLEDGVALNRKDEGRQTAIEACKTLDFGSRERLIRINSPRTELAMDDMQAVIEAQPDGVVIPKVESAKDVQDIAALLDEAEKKNGWDIGQIRLFAIIESARGVLHLPHIVASSDRLTALMFGSEDLAGDMGAIRTPEGWEVFYARSAVVTAAAAYQLDAIDTVFPDFNDMEGLEAETRMAKQMGYHGKMAIHPRQVDVFHKVFAPSEDEIEFATRLIAAHDAHQAQGTGAFAFEGKMVDMPMIRSAEKLLEKAKASA